MLVQCITCKHPRTKGAPKGFATCAVVKRPPGYSISLKSMHECKKHEAASDSQVAKRGEWLEA